MELSLNVIVFLPHFGHTTPGILVCFTVEDHHPTVSRSIDMIFVIVNMMNIFVIFLLRNR